MTFLNKFFWFQKPHGFLVQDLVADHVNVWLEENSSDVHRDVAVKAL